jgi:hypothetical protein
MKDEKDKGYGTCVGERNAYSVLVGDPDLQISFKIPRSSLDDNIKIYVK